MKTMATPRGTARALRRNHAAPSLRIGEFQRSHEYDEDAVCIHCGFDGAEWASYRASRHPDDRDPHERPPACTR